jgi:hypothetical protein
MANVFKELLQLGVTRGAVPVSTIDAIEWFRKTSGHTEVFGDDPEEVSQLRKIYDEEGSAPIKTILEYGNENQQLVSTFGSTLVGQLVMFEYDAKHKNTKKLKYYDKFPLAFPLEIKKDGFVGINLHYLSPGYRALLLDELYDITINQGDKRQLPMFGVYNILKTSAKYRYYKPCIKRYLHKHIKSSFLKVPPEEWDIAMWLPFERFRGGTKKQVWSESTGKF